MASQVLLVCKPGLETLRLLATVKVAKLCIQGLVLLLHGVLVHGVLVERVLVVVSLSEVVLLLVTELALLVEVSVVVALILHPTVLLAVVFVEVGVLAVMRHEGLVVRGHAIFAALVVEARVFPLVLFEEVLGSKVIVLLGS